MKEFLDLLSVCVGGAVGAGGRFLLTKRMEIWFLLKDWLERGSIPRDERLIADLCAPRYKFAGGDGKMQLESKDSMRKRGLPSPDVADALALTFSVPVQSRELRGQSTKALTEYPVMPGWGDDPGVN